MNRRGDILAVPLRDVTGNMPVNTPGGATVHLAAIGPGSLAQRFFEDVLS